MEEKLIILIESLKELKGGCPEQSHEDADELLLNYIDNDDVKYAFESIAKWYS